MSKANTPEQSGTADAQSDSNTDSQSVTRDGCCGHDDTLDFSEVPGTHRRQIRDLLSRIQDKGYNPVTISEMRVTRQTYYTVLYINDHTGGCITTHDCETVGMDNHEIRSWPDYTTVLIRDN